MKRGGDIGAVFTIIGTIVGAGFISGRELIEFFNCFKFSTIYLCSIMFFLNFLLLFKLGKKYDGYNNVIKEIFKKFSVFIRPIILVGAYVSCFGMLSGTNVLFPRIKYIMPPILMLLAIIIVSKGVKGLGNINIFLIPIIFLFIISMIIKKNSFSSLEKNNSNFIEIFSVCIYVSLNSLLAMPILCNLGAKINHPIYVSLFSAIIIMLLILFILSGVCSDKNSIIYDMPLRYILGNSKIFDIMVFGGMFTTLLSSFYPLYNTFKRYGNVAVFLLCVSLYVFSEISFKNIISLIYPSLGLIGIIIILVCMISYFSSWIRFESCFKIINKKTKL